MHAGAVQRKSSVYRPGLTKAQTSSRVSPFAMTDRHRRQRARPDGAALMRYVDFSCLKPLHLVGAGCGGGGGTGAWHGRLLPFALALHGQAAVVWQQDQLGAVHGAQMGCWCGCILAPHALVLARARRQGGAAGRRGPAGWAGGTRRGPWTRWPSLPSLRGTRSDGPFVSGTQHMFATHTTKRETRAS